LISAIIAASAGPLLDCHARLMNRVPGTARTRRANTVRPSASKASSFFFLGATALRPRSTMWA
jgi:hypothetical protein